MHQRHCGGALHHFLEVACGPARHSILLAQAAGVAATGLDLSPAMLRYAEQQAVAAGVEGKLTCVEADMSQGGCVYGCALALLKYIVQRSLPRC